MSARKSWDIAPKPKAPSRPAPAPQAPARPAPRRATPVRVPRSQASDPALARRRRERTPARTPLAAKRRKARSAFAIALSALCAVCAAAAVAAVWQPGLRVDSVTVSGPAAESVRSLALAELDGTYAYALPRDSLFLLPTEAIRARVLAAHPDIEALSFEARGTDELSIVAHPRAAVFLWCGDAPGAEGPCYDANAEGLVFARTESASSTLLRAYGPLEGEGAPEGRRIAYSSGIPDALRFVKALQSLGADVSSFAFRGDEADAFTRAGTRVTYVIGREAEAAGTAASVFPQLALNDGSIDYVDLRFEGKAYFRRATEGE